MSLIDALRVGLSGLNTASAGLETAQNNVANINTPGYARRRANIEEVMLSTNAPDQVFGGARAASIESIRSHALDVRVQTSRSAVSAAESSLSHLKTLESSLAPDGISRIAERVTDLFASFDRLSVRPEDTTLRAEVLNNASRVASSIRTAADATSNAYVGTQRELASRADRVNDLTGQLARVNAQIDEAGASSNSKAVLADRASLLAEEISKELDVRTFQDEAGKLSVALADGTALVAGIHQYSMTVDSVPGGAIRVEGKDKTDLVSGGAMGGILAVRDDTMAPALAQLDSLATALATEVNAQHQAGFDRSGNPGGALFATGGGGGPGAAARGFQAAITDPALLAAGAGPNPGDGGNASALADLATRDDVVTIGAATTTFAGAAATLLYNVGSNVRAAEDERLTADALLEQAVAARDQLSGVSLDEEAADMIRFQRAYEASSRFLATVNDLVGRLMNDLGR